MGRTEWEEFKSLCVSGTIPRMSLGEVRLPVLYGTDVTTLSRDADVSIRHPALADGYDACQINTTQVVRGKLLTQTNPSVTF